MDFIDTQTGHETALITLFTDVFAASEGTAEGAMIGGLVTDLLTDTPPEDLRVFAALDDGEIIGAILFSRLRFAGDDRSVFMMAPVAVATARHGQGVGQAVIRHGLTALLAEGVDVAVTYGDPDYYGRTGFLPVTENDLPPPMPLQFPHGWLAQPLGRATLAPFAGPSACVPAFNKPELW
jgi:predicted N-acetyltransferase YhbS